MHQRIPAHVDRVHYPNRKVGSDKAERFQILGLNGSGLSLNFGKPHDRAHRHLNKGDCGGDM